LKVGTKSDGTSAMHSFDLVSEDNQIVAEVKSHRLTKSGKTPSGKVSDTYHACSMLEKLNAQKKLLILTDSDFFELFKRYSDGKISSKIELVLLNMDNERRSSKSMPKTYSKVEDVSSENSEFGSFWSELQSWLMEKRTITNWTVDKGEVGEDFETGPVTGNHVLVYPPSALNVQKVSKKDFEFVYEKWTDYLNGDAKRSELAKKSRFAKYTISIIHQYLSRGQKVS
jgi:hypothetical protein